MRLPKVDVSPSSTAKKQRRLAEAMDHLHDRARKFAANGNSTNAEKLEDAALLYASARLSHPRPGG